LAAGCKNSGIYRRKQDILLCPTLVDLLLLVHGQLAWTHVDQEKETAADPKIRKQDKNRAGEVETYTIDRIWKKSYLAKSL
jgi:hypothetical protein